MEKMIGRFKIPAPQDQMKRQTPYTRETLEKWTKTIWEELLEEYVYILEKPTLEIKFEKHTDNYRYPDKKKYSPGQIDSRGRKVVHWPPDLQTEFSNCLENIGIALVELNYTKIKKVWRENLGRYTNVHIHFAVIRSPYTYPINKGPWKINYEYVSECIQQHFMDGEISFTIQTKAVYRHNLVLMKDPIEKAGYRCDIKGRFNLVTLHIYPQRAK